MTEPSGLDLVALAPDVDRAASRALFDRQRARGRRRRRHRRIGAGVAAAALLVAGGVAIAARPWSDRDDTTIASAPTSEGPADGAAIGFEVLRVEGTADRMGSLRAATDAGELDRVWAAAGLSGAPPAVDLAGQVVVTITIPDDACPPELTRFDAGDGTVTPVFTDVTRECDEPLIHRTFVVAIDRVAVAPRFTLRLPADETYGFAEQRLAVDVPSHPPTTAPGDATAGPAVSPAVGPAPSSADDTTPPAQSPDEAPEAVDAFVRFARAPSAETAGAVPFASRVDIGLGHDLLAELDASSRPDPAAWRLDLDLRWGGVGTVSALDLLAAADGLETVRDRQISCVGPSGRPMPPGYEGHTSWSLEPSDIDSCLAWFAVDVYLDDDATIAAVTVELWEP